MSWEINGILGRGDAPAQAGTCKGLGIVLGTARCAFLDIHGLSAFQRGQAGILAINGMILFWHGRIHHGISMHPRELELWRKLRRLYEGRDSNEFLTHSCKAAGAGEDVPDVVWDVPAAIKGTSGLFAVIIGLALGYERIVLCGVPLDGSGHLYDSPELRSVQFTQDWLDTEWIQARDEIFKGRVRSLSGRTKQWLGEPDEQWLREVT